MTNRWSASVTQKSDALDLEKGIFTWSEPDKIATSLLRSAKASNRRKSSSAYQSAMSMLNLYINRAGKNLPQKQTDILNQAKHVLQQRKERGKI